MACDFGQQKRIKMNKNVSSISIVLIVLLLAALACNIPTGQTNTGSPVISGDNPLPVVTQPPVVVLSGLPIITMDGGTGYLFPSGEITSGDNADRDIWWNASQFVPATLMGSLGQIDNLSAVTGITASSLTFGTFVPTTGEGFAVEVSRDGQKTYALMRVVNIDSELVITFEWIYPFAGQVLP
jgi:hypothetical protein